MPLRCNRHHMLKLSVRQSVSNQDMEKQMQLSNPPVSSSQPVPKTYQVRTPPLNLRSVDRLIIGHSKPTMQIKQWVEKVAASGSTVLITGESGTGKEIIARAIHNLSRRAGKPFVSVNCGAIPETLIESELFGSVKGGFTGAIVKKGLLVAAQDGTIFLDELGEMPTPMQVKLLRVLQERKVRPVGATDSQEIRVDARIIAATNKNLEREVAEGRFRQDLYFRLNVLAVYIPPLRERCADIPPLTLHLLDKLCQRANLLAPARIKPAAQRLLNNYSWPGNVRELENVLERLSVVVGGRAAITVDDVRHTVASSQGSVNGRLEWTFGLDDGETFNENVDRYKIELYHRVLDSVGGNHAEAARKLKINRTALYERIRLAKQRLAVAS